MIRNIYIGNQTRRCEEYGRKFAGGKAGEIVISDVYEKILPQILPLILEICSDERKVKIRLNANVSGSDGTGKPQRYAWLIQMRAKAWDVYGVNTIVLLLVNLSHTLRSAATAANIEQQPQYLWEVRRVFEKPKVENRRVMKDFKTWKSGVISK